MQRAQAMLPPVRNIIDNATEESDLVGRCAYQNPDNGEWIGNQDHQIDIEHIAVCEAKNEAPATANADAPVPFQIAFQRVQAISGKVNVRRP